VRRGSLTFAPESPANRNRLLRGLVGDGEDLLHPDQLASVGPIDVRATHLAERGLESRLGMLERRAERFGVG